MRATLRVKREAKTAKVNENDYWRTEDAHKKYTYKTTPYEHQRNALIKGAKELNFAYFLEMGTGKTKVAIDVVALVVNLLSLYQ